MTTKNLKYNENRLSSEPWLYIMAAQLDKKSREFAKWLDHIHYTYALYGALDGLSLSYSTIKYAFDVLLTNTKILSSDAMHEWMLTPTGMVVAISESFTFMTLSILANYYSNEDKNWLKRTSVISWPYVRDVIKALKNGYKGVRSAIIAADLLSSRNLNYLILPIGFVLSVLAVINRIWIRSMLSERKSMMKKNGDLYQTIQINSELSHEECEIHRNKILGQSTRAQRLGLLAAAYSGAIDSLYLYVGVLGLCAFTWPALAIMTVFCAIYSVSCIAARIYEEYSYQRDLAITKAKIKLALFSKEFGKTMQNECTELEELSSSKTANQEKHSSLTMKIKQFIKKRNKLQSLSVLSNTSAFLSGLKDGLAAYGAMTSILFAVTSLIISPAAFFPPLLVISCISAGMVFLTGFVAYSIIQAAQHRREQTKNTNQSYDQLSDMRRLVNEANDCSNVSSSPKFSFQEWSEVFRSFFSGLGKGPKVSDYILNDLQTKGNDGHYHETPFMFIIALANSIFYALVMSLRALARGFGRTPLTEIVIKKEATISTVERIPERVDTALTAKPQSIVNVTKKVYNSQNKPLSPRALNSIFPPPSSEIVPNLPKQLLQLTAN